MTRELPKRTYGKTGVQMPILALGGAGVLQDASRTAEAIAIIREAVEQGVYYLDTAQQYRDSERIFGEAIDGIRNKVFLSTKSAARLRRRVARPRKQPQTPAHRPTGAVDCASCLVPARD